jgi:hypothetical protein
MEFHKIPWFQSPPARSILGYLHDYGNLTGKLHIVTPIKIDRRAIKPGNDEKRGERSSRIYIIHYHPGKIGALCFGNPYNDMMGCGKPNSGHQHFISHWRLICYIHGLYFDINQQCGMLCSKMKDASICGSLNAESGDATLGVRVPIFSNKPISLFLSLPLRFSSSTMF